MASPLTILGTESGRSIGFVVHTRLGLSWREIRRLFRENRVLLSGKPCPDSNRPVRAGQQIKVNLPKKGVDDRDDTQAKRARGHGPTIRFVDGQVVVVDKPAGLTTMRHATEAAEFGSRGRHFLPVTLADLLPGLLSQRLGKTKSHGDTRQKRRVRAVHRLDKDTSGLVAFALTPEAERHLGQQFRAHSIERSYIGVVRGRAVPGKIESRMVPDRGDGRRGSTSDPCKGKKAVTHVRVLEELGEFTLVECRLETGRTHQVRIHLGESGTPLCGETIYDRPLHGKPFPDNSGAPRLALHAASLGLVHPATGKKMAWNSPLPEDLETLVERLRRQPMRNCQASGL